MRLSYFKVELLAGEDETINFAFREAGQTSTASQWKEMNYYSTNDRLHPVSLRQAVLHCFAPDGGVYMPDRIPLFPQALFRNIPQMSLREIGYIVATSMFGSDIPAATLNDIVRDTLTFEIPLVEVEKNLYALELFHGPTGTFKDIGARFLARIVEYFIKSGGADDKKINVFVATSGDTGCAVADGFAGLDNINVFLFHPKSSLLRVPSDAYAKTASNIHPIALRGTFEDCQQIARQIYSDPELNRRMTITSANTVNIARLLPQVFFYFHAYARLLERNEKPGRIVVSTPCGNLGNLTAAIFAGQMGLPVDRILASGYGDERLWGSISQSGMLKVDEFNSKALSTNLARINCLLKNNPAIASKIDCHTFGDEEVADEINYMSSKAGYRLNRNSAMACRAARQALHLDESSIFLATTDPARLPEKLHNCQTTAGEFHNKSRKLTSEPILPLSLHMVRDQIMRIVSQEKHP